MPKKLLAAILIALVYVLGYLSLQVNYAVLHGHDFRGLLIVMATAGVMAFVTLLLQ